MDSQIGGSKGRHPEVRNAFAASQLSFLTGRRGNCDCRATERHLEIRTTLNVYGDVVTNEMAQANSKVARMALSRAN
jgi:hypothetical protein